MISRPHIAAARVLMKLGSSMQEAAITLKVRSQDLDLALWRNLEVATNELMPSRERVRRHMPDFE